MPRLDTLLSPDGPILTVRIWVGPEHEHDLRVRRLPVPRPVSVPGLVAPGARMSAIDQSLAEGLRLPVHDWVGLSGSVLGADRREAPTYVIRMTFGSLEAQEPPRWRTILAAGVGAVSPGATILIGQDMLATCRFTYDGRKQRLTMTY
jgi:hypothetical protein